MEWTRAPSRTEQERARRRPGVLGTPVEWVGVLMDYTVGTGIVLWHFLVAGSAAPATTNRRRS